MTSVDISVIIPTYNRLWALPEAIQSCRESECRTEILVIDDGSTDGTWEWLQTQSEIVAIRQEHWGKDWAVNKAFGVAAGEFVRFLDSDDMLISGANDAQLAIARRSNADVVVAGHCVLDEIAGASWNILWEDCDDFVAQQLGECSSSHYSAYLIRKSFITCIPHRQEFGVKDDRMFVIELAIRRPEYVVWNCPAFVHRHHVRGRLQSPGATGTRNANRQLFAVYRQAVSLLEERGELTQRRRQAAIKMLWPLAHWIAYADLDEGVEVLDLIQRLDPNFRPPGSGLLAYLYRQFGFRWVERMLGFRRVLLRPVASISQRIVQP